MDKARWRDLSRLQRGALVVFAEDWYIFPEGIVPAGTRACVTDQALFAEPLYACISVTPVTPIPGLDLLEWDGEIHVRLHGSSLYDLSPLRIA